MTCLLLVLLACGCSASRAVAADAAAEASPQPVAVVDHVLIISVDGLRPDLLLRGEAPVMQRLYPAGSYSFWARTTEAAVTNPSHVSMLTGVPPQQHGVNWNRIREMDESAWPRVPTLMQLARHHGYTAAVAAGKDKLVVLAHPDATDWSHIPPEGEYYGDLEVAEGAARIIREHRPNVIFVHLPQVDGAGHRHGWGSAEQMRAIANADEAVGMVLEALDAAGIRRNTAIILTADHGGAGHGHGRDDPRSRHIPWILVGPGVREDHDLTLHRDLVINTEDTFAMACYLLNIPLPREIAGKVVRQALQEPQRARVPEPAPPAELLFDAEE